MKKMCGLFFMIIWFFCAPSVYSIEQKKDYLTFEVVLADDDEKASSSTDHYDKDHNGDTLHGQQPAAHNSQGQLNDCQAQYRALEYEHHQQMHANLARAVELDDVKWLRALLIRKADITQKNDFLVKYAIAKNRPYCLELLIEAKATVDLARIDMTQPQYFVNRQHCLDVLQSANLDEKSADILCAIQNAWNVRPLVQENKKEDTECTWCSIM
ncbi:MAG: hypothetical protein NTX86_01055 [Candidatus Dependentiae bacterium]|nr:hypothetical protein [Candidatus Dependentiae bacterium]